MRGLVQPDWDFVVWVQTSFLGDMILSTGAFRLFKEKFPDRKQILITTSVGASALKDHPDLDAIIVFRKGGLALKSMLQVKKNLHRLVQGRGIVLQAHRSFRSSLLSRLLAYPVVTYQQSSASWLATAVVERIAVFHEVVRVALLLEPLGFKRQDICKVLPRLGVLAQGSQKVAAFFSTSDQKVAAIVPGSVWLTKKWPAQSYAEVARWLLRNEWRVLLLGAKNELSDARVIDASVAALAGPGQYLNLVGETSLDDLRNIYPKLDLVICNDSSSLHYASAFQRPSISIFGATVPAMGFGPLSAKSVVVENLTLTCRPCGDHGPNRCPLGHFRCMLDIGPKRVIQEIFRFPQDDGTELKKAEPHSR